MLLRKMSISQRSQIFDLLLMSGKFFGERLIAHHHNRSIHHF